MGSVKEESCPSTTEKLGNLALSFAAIYLGLGLLHDPRLLYKAAGLTLGVVGFKSATDNI
jgi:hypothetical protein